MSEDLEIYIPYLANHSRLWKSYESHAFYYSQYADFRVLIIVSCYAALLQAREKFLSLRKGTKSDIATILEEVLFSITVKSWTYIHTLK